MCGVLAVCLRAATIAEMELWVKRRHQIPSMRPIAWKDLVAFTGFVTGIRGVRVAYSSFSLHLNLNFLTAKKVCKYPFEIVTYSNAPSRLGTSPCALSSPRRMMRDA